MSFGQDRPVSSNPDIQTWDFSVFEQAIQFPENVSAEEALRLAISHPAGVAYFFGIWNKPIQGTLNERYQLLQKVILTIPADQIQWGNLRMIWAVVFGDETSSLISEMREKADQIRIEVGEEEFKKSIFKARWDRPHSHRNPDELPNLKKEIDKLSGNIKILDDQLSELLKKFNEVGGMSTAGIEANLEFLGVRELLTKYSSGPTDDPLTVIQKLNELRENLQFQLTYQGQSLRQKMSLGRTFSPQEFAWLTTVLDFDFKLGQCQLREMAKLDPKNNTQSVLSSINKLLYLNFHTNEVTYNDAEKLIRGYSSAKDMIVTSREFILHSLRDLASKFDALKLHVKKMIPDADKQGIFLTKLDIARDRLVRTQVTLFAANILQTLKKTNFPSPNFTIIRGETKTPLYGTDIEMFNTKPVTYSGTLVTDPESDNTKHRIIFISTNDLKAPLPFADLYITYGVPLNHASHETMLIQSAGIPHIHIETPANFDPSEFLKFNNQEIQIDISNGQKNILLSQKDEDTLSENIIVKGELKNNVTGSGKPKTIVPFKDVDEAIRTTNFSTAPKGTSLTEFHSYVKTPAGWIIPQETFLTWIDEVGLGAQWRNLTSTAEKIQSPEFQNLVEQIMSTQIPEHLVDDVVRVIGEDNLARGIHVRSNTNGEDAQFNAAGLNLSMGNVKSRETLKDAMKSVFLAPYHENTLRWYSYIYSNPQNITSSELLMTTVNAQLSLVAIVSGDGKSAIMDANYGIGENVVHNRSISERFYLDLSGQGKIQHMVLNPISIHSVYINQDGQSVLIPYSIVPNEHLINDNQAQQLQSFLVKVRNATDSNIPELKGKPIDVEIIWGEKEPYLVQVRESPKSPEMPIPEKVVIAKPSSEKYETKINKEQTMKYIKYISEQLPEKISSMLLKYHGNNRKIPFSQAPIALRIITENNLESTAAITGTPMEEKFKGAESFEKQLEAEPNSIIADSDKQPGKTLYMTLPYAPQIGKLIAKAVNYIQVKTKSAWTEAKQKAAEYKAATNAPKPEEADLSPEEKLNKIILNVKANPNQLSQEQKDQVESLSDLVAAAKDVSIRRQMLMNLTAAGNSLPGSAGRFFSTVSLAHWWKASRDPTIDTNGFIDMLKEMKKIPGEFTIFTVGATAGTFAADFSFIMKDMLVTKMMQQFGPKTIAYIEKMNIRPILYGSTSIRSYVKGQFGMIAGTVLSVMISNPDMSTDELIKQTSYITASFLAADIIVKKVAVRAASALTAELLKDGAEVGMWVFRGVKCATLVGVVISVAEMLVAGNITDWFNKVDQYSKITAATFENVLRLQYWLEGNGVPEFRFQDLCLDRKDVKNQAACYVQTAISSTQVWATQMAYYDLQKLNQKFMKKNADIQNKYWLALDQLEEEDRKPSGSGYGIPVIAGRFKPGEWESFLGETQNLWNKYPSAAQEQYNEIRENINESYKIAFGSFLQESGKNFCGGHQTNEVCGGGLTKEILDRFHQLHEAVDPKLKDGWLEQLNRSWNAFVSTRTTNKKVLGLDNNYIQMDDMDLDDWSVWMMYFWKKFHVIQIPVGDTERSEALSNFLSQLILTVGNELTNGSSASLYLDQGKKRYEGGTKLYSYWPSDKGFGPWGTIYALKTSKDGVMFPGGTQGELWPVPAYPKIPLGGGSQEQNVKDEQAFDDYQKILKRNERVRNQQNMDRVLENAKKYTAESFTKNTLSYVLPTDPKKIDRAKEKLMVDLGCYYVHTWSKSVRKNFLENFLRADRNYESSKTYIAQKEAYAKKLNSTKVEYRLATEKEWFDGLEDRQREFSTKVPLMFLQIYNLNDKSDQPLLNFRDVVGVTPEILTQYGMVTNCQ